MATGCTGRCCFTTAKGSQPQSIFPPQLESTSSALVKTLQVVLGLTVVAAGGYGLHRLLLPYAREYYDRWNAARKDKSKAVTEKGEGGLSAQEQGTANALADAIWVRAVHCL